MLIQICVYQKARAKIRLKNNCGPKLAATLIDHASASITDTDSYPRSGDF
jgi:hypothetical protein